VRQVGQLPRIML